MIKNIFLEIKDSDLSPLSFFGIKDRPNLYAMKDQGLLYKKLLCDIIENTKTHNLPITIYEVLEKNTTNKFMIYTSVNLDKIDRTITVRLYNPGERLLELIWINKNKNYTLIERPHSLRDKKIHYILTHSLYLIINDITSPTKSIL